MKFSVALAACVAPLALAKAVQNVYPVKRGNGNRPQLDGIFRNNGIAGFGITETSLTEVVIIWANAGGNAQTQLINNQVTVTQTVTVQGGAAATVVSGQAGSNTVVAGATTVVSGAAATHSVTLGGPAGLVFFPDTIEANVGDMVIFTFQAANHTATQSAFAKPCEALAGGMDSGFMPNPNNTVSPPPQVAMQIMTKDPLWFYCRQKGHCGKGMTFSINPTAAKTQAMFQQMAISQNGTGSASGITGGTSSAAPAAAPAASESSLAALPSSGTSTDSLAPLPGATGTTSANTGSGIQSGTGTLNADGSCSCFVSCDTGSFPNVAAQGVNAFGGMSGSLPASMVETTT